MVWPSANWQGFQQMPSCTAWAACLSRISASLAVIVFGTTALSILVSAGSSWRPNGRLQRVRWSFTGLAAALVLAIGMAVAQLKGGTLTYYMDKLGIALFLAGLVTLALILAVFLETICPRLLAALAAGGENEAAAASPRASWRLSGAGPVAAPALAAVAATQAFGFTFRAAEGLPASSPSRWPWRKS